MSISINWLTLGSVEGPVRERLDRRLEKLEAILSQGLHEIHTIKKELAGMETGVSLPLPRSKQAMLFDEDGITNDLRGKIIRVLQTRDLPLTSAQLADALYVPHPDVSKDLFKRRVIVAVSAMHRNAHPMVVPAEGIPGRGREIHWTLKSKQEQNEEGRPIDSPQTQLP